MKKTMIAACALCLTAAIACAAPSARFISHRGESLDFPENTMAAFRAAVDRGANGFECDVYLTSDNEIVCIHDTTTDRTTDASLTVASSTLAQLQALDAGSWKNARFAGERIPTLSEALTLARDGFEIYVEIKCGVEIMPRLIAVMAAMPEATPERVVFISFSKAVITAARQQFPAYRAYWVTGSSLPAADMIAELRAMDASGLDIATSATGLDAAYVEAVKQAGFSFHVWTVNTHARAKELAAMGVETVTSDNAAEHAAALGGFQPVGVAPVIHWTFEGGVATNRGTGGPAYDAELVGLAAFTNGIDGGGLTFPGKGVGRGYAKVTHTFGYQGTVAFWHKPTSFFNHNSIFDNNRHENTWEMWLDSNGLVRFRLTGSQGDLTHDSLRNKNNDTNAWYHLAVTWEWDAGTSTGSARLYVNGLECHAAPITSWTQPGDEVYFGGGHSNNDPGAGTFDDVRIYESALTPEQVQALHAEIAAKVPVVHITLDETAENTGTGGTRYDATLFGAPAWTNGINDKGQALVLDGEDDHVSVSYRLPQAGAVALWYRPGRFYDYNSVFDNSAGGNHWEAWIATNGVLQFRCREGQTTVSQDLKSLLSTNGWHHIVATWNARSGVTTLYVNGMYCRTVMETNAWPVAGDKFYIGGGHDNNKFGEGVASDLQIFETYLTAERAADLYNEMGRRGGLVAYLPLDNTAVDVVGSNAVTVSGSPQFVKGQIGKGISYTAATESSPGGSCVSVSNVLGSSAGTIAMWLYVRGPWYDWQPVIDNSVNQEWWEGWIYADGRLAFRVSNISNVGGNGMVSFDLDNLSGPDNWYHAAFVWDRAAQQTALYVDGTRRATAKLPDAGWRDPDTTLHLGSSHSGNEAANCIWDEVRVYDRALTDDEIQLLTIIPPPPPPRGTVFLAK